MEACDGDNIFDILQVVLKRKILIFFIVFLFECYRSISVILYAHLCNRFLVIFCDFVLVRLRQAMSIVKLHLDYFLYLCHVAFYL